MGPTDGSSGNKPEASKITDDDIRIAGKELGIDDMGADEIAVLRSLLGGAHGGVLDMPPEQHELLYRISFAGYHIDSGVPVDDRVLALRSVMQQFREQEVVPGPYDLSI